MEDLGKLAGEIAKKHGKAFALEMIDAVLISALEQAAAKSATPIDDVVLGALKEPLRAALKDLVEKV